MKPQPGHKFIGRSVSKCFKMIAQGIVDPADVIKIAGNTAATSVDVWEAVIQRYTKNIWFNDAPKATELLRQFLAEGRIEQPLLQEEKDRVNYPPGSIWVEVPTRLFDRKRN
jgi:hypothetical protein